MKFRVASVAILTAVSLLGVIGTASAQSNPKPSVHITYLPVSASPDQIISIQASASPKIEECSAVILTPASIPTILPPHHTKTGEVHWQYTMPTTSYSGKWSVVISCSSLRHAIKHFTEVTSTSNDLITSCQSDGYAMLTAVAAFRAENQGVVVTVKGLIGKTLGGPYIAKLPSGGDYYSFGVANGIVVFSANLGDFAPFVSGDQCFILP